MKLVFCVDDGGGIAFNKRRQSRDSLVYSDIASLAGDDTVFLDPYSAELFSELDLNVIISESPQSSAEAGDIAFIERISPLAFAEKAEELIIYKWNRRYPSDVKMGFSPESLGFKLKSTFEFQGTSHEKITREIYGK